jgi:hypothetical protein
VPKWLVSLPEQKNGSVSIIKQNKSNILTLDYKRNFVIRKFNTVKVLQIFLVKIVYVNLRAHKY